MCRRRATGSWRSTSRRRPSGRTSIVARPAAPCSAPIGGRSDLFLRGFLRKRDDGARARASTSRWRAPHFGSDSVNIISQEHLVGDRERDVAHADAECHGLGGIPNALDERRPRCHGGMDAIGAHRDQRQRRLPAAVSASRTSAWVGAQASISPFSHVMHSRRTGASVRWCRRRASSWIRHRRCSRRRAASGGRAGCSASRWACRAPRLGTRLRSSRPSSS